MMITEKMGYDDEVPLRPLNVGSVKIGFFVVEKIGGKCVIIIIIT